MKRILRGQRPSPALLVSIIALAVAATGTAIAGNSIPGKGTVNSGDIKNKTIKQQDLGLAERPQWADVDATGAIFHQSGGITVNHSANGVYLVRFAGMGPKNSVLERGLAATLGGTGDLGSPQGGFDNTLSVHKLADILTRDTTVEVVSWDSRTTQGENAGFHIVLMPK